MRGGGGGGAEGPREWSGEPPEPGELEVAARLSHAGRYLLRAWREAEDGPWLWRAWAVASGAEAGFGEAATGAEARFKAFVAADRHAFAAAAPGA